MCNSTWRKRILGLPSCGLQILSCWKLPRRRFIFQQCETYSISPFIIFCFCIFHKSSMKYMKKLKVTPIQQIYQHNSTSKWWCTVASQLKMVDTKRTKQPTLLHMAFQLSKLSRFCQKSTLYISQKDILEKSSIIKTKALCESCIQIIWRWFWNAWFWRYGRG